MRSLRFRGTLAAIATSSAVGLVAAAPAHAGHLTGGTIAASIDGQGKAVGQMLWYEKTACTVGATRSANITVTPPTGAAKAFAITQKAFRCTASAAYYRSDFSFDLADATTGFGPSLPTGRYALKYSTCCRVGGILNASGGNVTLVATPRYVPGSKTSSPELLSPVPLGFGVGYGYDADFRPYDPDGAGAVTMQLLQGAQALQPFYDVDAPSSQRVTLGNDGHIRMTTAETGTYTAGQYVAYKVRATDADGDSTDHDVLLGATNNIPPVLATGNDTLTVAPGATLTVPVVATDANVGDVVSLAVDGQPSWATFTQTAGNPATGELKLAPPAGTRGTTSFTVDALDNNPTLTLQATRRYTVTVAAPAPVPVVEELKPIVAETPKEEPPVVLVPEVVAPQPKAPTFGFAGLEKFAEGDFGKAVAFFDAPAPGTFVVGAYATVSVPSRGASRAATVKRLQLFTRTKTVHEPGRVSLDLTLTRASLKKLAHHGLGRVVVKARFVPDAGTPTEISRAFQIKRFSMLFVRAAQLTKDGKGLRTIVRVPGTGRLRAVARVTHDGQVIDLGASAVRTVERGEQDVYVRFAGPDVQHLLGAGTTDVRITTVLDRPGRGRQTRTRKFRLVELAR